MRTAGLVVWFGLALVACGCGSSLAKGTDVGGSADGGTFCPVPLTGDCSTSLQPSANFCTLNTATDAACHPCGAQDGSQGCPLKGALVRGQKYTYVQVMNVDVADVFVFDASQTLIAELAWSANGAAAGLPWSCTAGPAFFDPSEATALLPAHGGGELVCPAVP